MRWLVGVWFVLGVPESEFCPLLMEVLQPVVQHQAVTMYSHRRLLVRCCSPPVTVQRILGAAHRVDGLVFPSSTLLRWFSRRAIFVSISSSASWRVDEFLDRDAVEGSEVGEFANSERALCGFYFGDRGLVES